MTDISLDENGGRFLVLRVATGADTSGVASAGERWCAHVCELTSPLAGLHAYGASLDEASDAVAVLAWRAVTNGELEPFGYTALNLAGVHIAPASTRTYDAEWLTAAVDDPHGAGVVG
ncbi:MAG: hypothetical protein QOD07_164 [Frankiaceae bacterium]|jgi:hypothetical protein|nr:hypothetical protein [Frankiaceae bacterium]